MTWVKHNIRLTPLQDRALIKLAERQGLTRYKMLGRIVEAGLAQVESGTDAAADQAGMIAEIAATGVRLVEIERVLDRALFTACAGYCYARNTALGLRRSDETITAEAVAAYERQRSLASEVVS